jgi:hypothetical protein
VELLLDALDAGKSAEVRYVLESKLVVRATTAVAFGCKPRAAQR